MAHRLRIFGRVQGVGFRAFVAREAASRRVNGWVRNRTDGTVEALVWGDEAVIDDLLRSIRVGPRWGRVDRLDVTVEMNVEGRPDGFHVRADR